MNVPDESKNKGKSKNQSQRFGADPALTTLQDNLSLTHFRLCHLLESALLNSDELANHLQEVLPASTDFLSDAEKIHLRDDMGTLHAQFLEHHAKGSSLPVSPLSSQKPQLMMLYRSLGTAERVVFCRTMAQSDHVPQHIPELVQMLYGQTDSVDREIAGRIAYQRNIFTDEAYLHFSPQIHAPKATYAGSFSGVCEQVYNGLCEYCILPLENSQDGKLLRFYDLIQKYELKIVLTCDVTASDKRQTTTFGLCKRSLQVPTTLLYGNRRNTCFELIFRQDSDDYPSLTDLLIAAQACSLKPIRVDCLPKSDDEIMIGAGYPFDISLDLENGDLRTFLLFLALDAPFCMPLGIYCHL